MFNGPKRWNFSWYRAAAPDTCRKPELVMQEPYTVELYVMITQHFLPMSRGAEHNVFFDPSGQKCQIRRSAKLPRVSLIDLWLIDWLFKMPSCTPNHGKMRQCRFCWRTYEEPDPKISWWTDEENVSPPWGKILLMLHRYNCWKFCSQG